MPHQSSKHPGYSYQAQHHQHQRLCVPVGNDDRPFPILVIHLDTVLVLQSVRKLVGTMELLRSLGIGPILDHLRNSDDVLLGHAVRPAAPGVVHLPTEVILPVRAPLSALVVHVDAVLIQHVQYVIGLLVLPPKLAAPPFAKEGVYLLLREATVVRDWTGGRFG